MDYTHCFCELFVRVKLNFEAAVVDELKKEM